MKKQHVCGLCNAEFGKSDHLIRHLNRLRKCNIDTGFSCDWCNKHFSTQSNITRHCLTCNVKRMHDLLEKKIEEDKQTSDTQFKVLEEKYELLEKKMLQQCAPNITATESVIPTITQSGNNTNSPTTSTATATAHSYNTNTTNHIKKNIINNYGCENLAHMTVKRIAFVFNKCFRSVVECVKLIHFSPFAPENQNVCIKDLKSKYVYIFCDGNWDITGRTELIDDMYDEICDYIEQKLSELIDEIDENNVARIQQFLSMKDDDDTIKRVKDDLRKLLFNKRTAV